MPVDTVSATSDADPGKALGSQIAGYVEIEPGTFLSPIGKSGSGRSRLLNATSGVLEPTSGSVQFGTRDGDDDVTIGHVR